MVSRQAIQDYVDAVVREFRPERVVLFGSYAYGEPSADSDVDLLVVMPYRGNSLGQAFKIRNRLEHPGFAMDLLVRSPQEIKRRLAMGDSFVGEIVERGKPLYARANS
jgi:uncharacterized protein